MKTIFDYLLIEEKFEPFIVAGGIRILCHSLETTKLRMEQLKKVGCRPTSLIVLCKSKAEFEKHIKNLVDKS